MSFCVIEQQNVSMKIAQNLTVQGDGVGFGSALREANSPATCGAMPAASNRQMERIWQNIKRWFS